MLGKYIATQGSGGSCLFFAAVSCQIQENKDLIRYGLMS